MKKTKFFSTMLILASCFLGSAQMNIPDNYNNQTIPISGAAYDASYTTKSFTTSDYDALMGLSQAYSGLPKVSSIVVNATAWPYYAYSSTVSWSEGSWGRGYEDAVSSEGGNYLADRDYEWYNSFSDSHPLIRDASVFVRGHIYMYLNGYTTNENLQKIKDGIDFLLAEQSGNDTWTVWSGGLPHQRNNLGGYKWYLERQSQYNIASSSANKFSDYETSNALAALSEYYLSEINYRRTEVLSAINLASQFLITQVDFDDNQGWLLQVNSNTRGLAAWGLSLAYRATRDCEMFNKALSIAAQLYSAIGTDGQWHTGGTEISNINDVGPDEVIYHDEKIFYHFMALRGLVEVFSILPDNHTQKRIVNEAINKAVNHVINYRTFPVNNTFESELKYLYSDISGTVFCQWRDYMAEIEKYVETLSKLTYYAKNSIYYSTQDFENLKNLTNRVAKKLVSTDHNYLYPIAAYSRYMDAINGTNIQPVLGWNNFTTNYNAGRISGRVVSGDFDGNGFEDDIAALYDYGNNIYGGQSSAIQVWNSKITTDIKYKGDNGLWFSKYFNALKVGDRIVTGDFNNDGIRNDIAMIYDNSNGTATISVFNYVAGSFVQSSQWTGTINVANIVSVTNGNYDNDAYEDDITLLMTDGGSAYHFENFIGSGSSFTKYSSMVGLTFNATKVQGRVVSGDFDNDGKLDDIAMFYDYGNNSTQIWVFKSNNAAVPTFTASSFWTGNSFNANGCTNRVVSGDFDRDGRLDDIAVFYDYGGSSTQAWVFKSSGTSMTTTSYITLSPYDANNLTNRLVSGNFDPVWSGKYGAYAKRKDEIMGMHAYSGSNDWQNFTPNTATGNSTFIHSYSNWDVQTSNCVFGSNAKSSETTTATTTEIDLEDNARDEISVYPNPFSEQLFIENLRGENTSIRLYDESGRLLLEQNTTESKASLSTNNLPNGNYLLITENSAGILEQRIVIKR